MLSYYVAAATKVERAPREPIGQRPEENVGIDTITNLSCGSSERELKEQ